MGEAPSRVAQVTARYERRRQQFDDTAAGHLTRRALEVDVIHQALVFAALGFMLVVPILISLSALVPLGADGGVAAGFAARVGLTDEATRDLQVLFPAQATVRASATWGGVLLSVVCAISWPLTLQKGYELAWGLPRAGFRELWRPVAWLFTVVALIVVVALLGVVSSVGDGSRSWCSACPHSSPGPGGPSTSCSAAGSAWRPLLPGAVAIALGLVGLKVLAELLLSTSIVTHSDLYGPIGVVFILLSWLIALSVVFLGGALLGATLAERARGRAAADVTEPASEPAHEDTA